MLEGLNVFIGLMGAGKSYGMTLAIYRAWKSGVHVYSIGTLFPPEKYRHLYTKISKEEVWKILNHDFIKSGTGEYVILALDEGWILFDSYDKLKIDTRVLLMSARKNGVNVYITAQRWGLVNINFRAVCDRIFICDSRSFFGLSLFRYLEFGIQENSDTGQLTDEPVQMPSFFNLGLWRLRKKTMYKYYDTWEKIVAMYPIIQHEKK